MKHQAKWIVAFAGVAMSCCAASADVAVIGADRDNTMYQDPLGTISSGAGPTMFVGETNVGSFRRGLIRFDLSPIPAGSTIVSVQLTLHMSRTISGDASVSIFRALRDWGEGSSNAGANGGRGAPATPGDATWLHTFFDTQFWSAPGGASGADYAATASATTVVTFAIQTYSWGSTPEMVADAQAWLALPSSNFGWFLIGDESAFATAKRFDTRENLNPSFRPSLTVTYTPPAPPCYANCDGSTVSPVLNANDFQCFLDAFAANSSYANCDGSTVGPVLNANDFQCFLDMFAGGC